MPRRNADERHRLDDDVSTDLIDVLIAFHHPTRRWLHEILALEGPSSVGRLSARTGLAVGSVSHHLKPLHQQGFVEPAPDLARDTRESWWRVVPRSLTWGTDDFEEGTPGRLVADQAEAENFRHQVRAVRQWLSTAGGSTETWRRSASSTDSLTRATPDQLADLGTRVQALVETWVAECREDEEARPEVERSPVRVIARTFPTVAVRP